MLFVSLELRYNVIKDTTDVVSFSIGDFRSHSVLFELA